jgi:fumarate reductase flavoprotein subunit
VHGANRLGGNGVANSTVFGAIAGDSMATFVAREGRLREPNGGTTAASIAHAERPFATRDGGGDLEAIREKLHATMWDDCGIVRDAASLARAENSLAILSAQLEDYALPAPAHDRAFNLAWHDWLNLTSLVAVSRSIVCAALAREDSRGAHYRSDFPHTGDLAKSTHTRVRAHDGDLRCEAVPVRFSRIRPGGSSH